MSIKEEYKNFINKTLKDEIKRLETVWKQGDLNYLISDEFGEDFANKCDGLHEMLHNSYLPNYHVICYSTSGYKSVIHEETFKIKFKNGWEDFKTFISRNYNSDIYNNEIAIYDNCQIVFTLKLPAEIIAMLKPIRTQLNNIFKTTNWKTSKPFLISLLKEYFNGELTTDKIITIATKA